MCWTDIWWWEQGGGHSNTSTFSRTEHVIELICRDREEYKEGNWTERAAMKWKEEWKRRERVQEDDRKIEKFSVHTTFKYKRGGSKVRVVISSLFVEISFYTSSYFLRRWPSPLRYSCVGLIPSSSAGIPYNHQLLLSVSDDGCAAFPQPLHSFTQSAMDHSTDSLPVLHFTLHSVLWTVTVTLCQHANSLHSETATDPGMC